MQDIKSEATTSTPIIPADNALNQLETMIAILRRTPDLPFAINDVMNIFHIAMMAFSNATSQQLGSLFEDAEQDTFDEILLTIKMCCIRYEKQFPTKKELKLTKDECDHLMQVGLVLPEEYELFTGEKMEMQPTPDIQTMDMPAGDMSPEMMEQLRTQMAQQPGNVTPFETAMGEQLKDGVKH